MKNELEKSKVWWDKKGFVRTKITKDQNEEGANNFVKMAEELFEQLNIKGIKEVDSLHDVRDIKITMSFNVRKIYTDWLEREKKRGFTYKKTALFGIKGIQKNIAKLLFVFIGMVNIKFFNTEEDALKWLQEE